MKVKLVSILAIVMLTSACSSLKFWEDESLSEEEIAELAVEADAEDTSEPRPLKAYNEAVVIRKLWRSSAGAGQEVYAASLQPAVSDTAVFATNPEGEVSAFNKSDGDRLWRTDLETVLTGGVGVGAGLALVANIGGQVIALAADTGKERWRASLTSEVLAPPVASGERVVVQTQDGKIHGLSAASGELVWRYTTELPVLTLRGTATPVVVGNMAILGLANGELVALNLLNGELLWETKFTTGEGKTELERIVDVNTPVVVGDIIYASSYQGKVGAVSRGAGRELWTQAASSYHAPSYGPGRLYMVGADDRIHSYRASGGIEQWVNEDFLRRKLSAPIALNDFIAVADREGYLHLLAPEDGEVIGRVKVDGDGVSVPMVASVIAGGEGESARETLFVLDNSGNLTAYQFRMKDS